MPQEIFRLVNVRMSRPASITVIDDVVGTPPLMKAVAHAAGGRSLTPARLAELIEAGGKPERAAVEALPVTELGRRLDAPEEGDASDLRELAASVDLSSRDLRAALSQVADAWLGAQLGRAALAREDYDLESVRVWERALRGAELVRRLQALGARDDPRDAIASVARAPVAARDQVGIPAALRSSQHPEDLTERREQALASRVPSAASRCQLGERVARKLFEAHVSVGQQLRQAADSSPLEEATEPGALTRFGRWLFGGAARPESRPLPATESAARISEEFDRRLVAEERVYSTAVFGGAHQNLSGNLGQAMAALDAKREQDLRAAMVSASQPRLGVPARTVVYPRPPLRTPGFNPGVRVAGIGDLIVARESHKRYEAEEIAHIENVLPLEERLREHRQRKTVETLVERETGQETETEQDLRTAERFELQSESERSIDSQFGIDFGVNVSAKYGFVGGEISVDSDFGITYNRRVTETERQASSFAREVVSRSLERIRERVRELRRVTISETVDELNRHAIRGLPVPFSAVYKWVNKVQEVELRHFGQRLMVEFYVPEPGLRLMRLAESPDLAAPEPLTLGPADITPDLYMDFARQFGALGVEPPPPLKRTVEAVFSRKADKDRTLKPWTDVDIKESVPLPEGYAPTHASAIVTSANKFVLGAVVTVGGTVVVNGRVAGGQDSGLVPLSFVEPRGDTGVGVTIRLVDFANTPGFDVATVHVTVVCERLPESFFAWQIATYGQLVEGHERQVAAYNQRVAQQAAAAGTRIRGRNPAENRALERDELKRWSIELLRVQPFDINSIDEAGMNPPDVAFDRVDGNRNLNLFCERAFEWPQMTYWFYPYFWGRSELWADRLRLADADPLHQHFLRAGAARVLVPVTPGYEERVLHYLYAAGPEDQRVVWTPDLDRQARNPRSVIPPLAVNPDLWMEVILAKNKELAYGSGTLTVRNASRDVTINPDSDWVMEGIDVGREVYIEGFPYTIAERVNDHRFRLAAPYQPSDNDQANYLVSSIRIGSPWEVVVPTNLVVLSDQADKLNRNAGVNALDEAVINRVIPPATPPDA